MDCPSLLSKLALATALAAAGTAAQAFDDATYPNFAGQWTRLPTPGILGQAGTGFDPSKPWGLGQQAPLTPEYRKVLEASIAEQANGGQGNWHTGAECLPPGMPAMMNPYQAMEFIVLPETTYIRIDHAHDSHRRIYTDGRDWPKDAEPSFLGYSIGHWVDSEGTGHFDTLEVETRFLKGPRPLDPSGMPTHVDNESIIKERIFLDKTKPDVLHDEITLIDHAYTRPWVVMKNYRREPVKFPEWTEYNCTGENELIKIGNETYFRGGDGNLMPTRRDQPPPDLSYFPKTRASR
jgi:hypothetical protein